jgi:hypothetical protein
VALLRRRGGLAGDVVKIRPEHYAYLRDAIATIPLAAVDAHRAAVLESGRFTDLDKRVRWDLLHSVVPAAWICDNLYPYMNDSHLDTALRAIVAEGVSARLEYLRGEVRAERISYGEIAELQGLGEQGHIPADDVELREWAGLPEFEPYCEWCTDGLDGDGERCGLPGCKGVATLDAPC